MNQDVARTAKAFFESFPLKTFAKSELVVFGDESIPPVTYLVEGQVGQYDITDAGRKNMITIYKPGAFFPMVSAVNNMPNKHFFEALTAVRVRQAPAEEAVAFLRREPAVLFDLLQRLYRGVDAMASRMSLLMSGTAEDRLLFELLITADRFGEKQPDGSTLIKITETQLAAQTGLARETVSRELQKLIKAGHAKPAKSGIYLLTR